MNGQGSRAAEIGSAFRVPVRDEAFGQLDRVGGRVDLHIGGNQDIVADADFVAVHEGAIHVDRHIAADVDVAPVVTQEGRGDGNMGAHAPEDLVEETCAFLLPVVGQGIVGGEQVARRALVFEEDRVVTVVEFPSEAFFEFVHSLHDVANLVPHQETGCFKVVGGTMSHRQLACGQLPR